MRMSGWPSAQGISLVPEAQQVISPRLMQPAIGGPEMQVEARHMVDEKLPATIEAARLVMTGMMRGDGAGSPADVLRMLWREIRDDREHLAVRR